MTAKTDDRRDRMSAADFCLWLAAATKSDSDAARKLGCARNSIEHWSFKGAPRYIGLACAAIICGLEPWRKTP